METLGSLLPCDNLTSCVQWLDQFQSPLTKGWLLADVRFNAFLIVAYLLSIPALTLFMKYARGGRPFAVNWLILLHNFNLFLWSIFMSYRIFHSAWVRNGYSLFGNAVQTRDGDAAADLALMLWVNAVSKVIEFLDTAIMIFKCNFHQLSFLHVYHHCTVIAIWWAILFFSPGGEPYFVAGTNAAVHVVMYAYYFMANLYSTLKKNDVRSPLFTVVSCHLVIKPYITVLQMVQFVLFTIQGFVDLFVLEPFGFPRALSWIIFLYPVTLLVLFGNFFLKSFLGKRDAKKGKADGHENGNGTSKAQNGLSNGHQNGHSNGYPNGVHTNGDSNGNGMRLRRSSRQL